VRSFRDCLYEGTEITDLGLGAEGADLLTQPAGVDVGVSSSDQQTVVGTSYTVPLYLRRFIRSPRGKQGRGSLHRDHDSCSSCARLPACLVILKRIRLTNEVRNPCIIPLKVFICSNYFPTRRQDQINIILSHSSSLWHIDAHAPRPF
jgi:hypothetical protein